MILLFGPTEFKAQIGWIDTITVRYQRILSCSPPFLIFVIRGSRGWSIGSKYNLQSSPFSRLNLLSRSDAVIIYEDPQEETA